MRGVERVTIKGMATLTGIVLGRTGSNCHRFKPI